MSAFIKCPDCGETVVHELLTDGQALEIHRREDHGTNVNKKQVTTLEQAIRAAKAKA